MHDTTDSTDFRARLYQTANKLTILSILMQPRDPLAAKAWRYVGQLSRGIQHDLLEMAGAERRVITAALSPVQRPWERACEGENFIGKEGA